MTGPTSPPGHWQVIGTAIRRNPVVWLAITIGFALAYYLMLMVALVAKFGSLPNYAVAYDWPANVVKIIRSTPSFRDMVPIVADEWLFEFGYMNYEYGHGISEWALNIIPAKALVVLLLGGLIATFYLVRREKKSCGTPLRAGHNTAGGLGAFFVAFTSATMSWVVCCATPSWIVGLSMMGLGVSASLWLEPIGPFISVAGFAILAGAIYAAAKPARSEMPAGAKSAMTSTFTSLDHQEYRL